MLDRRFISDVSDGQYLSTDILSTIWSRNMAPSVMSGGWNFYTLVNRMQSLKKSCWFIMDETGWTTQEYKFEVICISLIIKKNIPTCLICTWIWYHYSCLVWEWMTKAGFIVLALCLLIDKFYLLNEKLKRN